MAQAGSPDEQANILNTLAVSLKHYVARSSLPAPLSPQLAPVIYGNKVVVALIMFMFLSIAWLDLSLRHPSSQRQLFFGNLIRLLYRRAI